MSRLRTAQELIHWLEVGAGAKWIRLAAVLFVGLVLSLRVAWTQFRGPLSETTLLQADLGRQVAAGQGFTTLVNYPQTAAVLAQRGRQFDPRQPYPELSQAPLYAVVIAGGLRLLPAGFRESLFTQAPVPPDGFRGDYFLLGLNLILFWASAWLTYDLGRRLFAPRVGWLAALAPPPMGQATAPDWSTLAARSRAEWRGMDGVGATRAKRLRAFFADPEVRALAARLGEAGVVGF